MLHKLCDNGCNKVTMVQCTRTWRLVNYTEDYYLFTEKKDSVFSFLESFLEPFLESLLESFLELFPWISLKILKSLWTMA